MFSQLPIDIDYWVDVTPCRNQALNVPVPPSDLIIVRTTEISHTNTYAMSPTYRDLFVSTNPTGCLILWYDLLDTQSAVLNVPQVVMVQKLDPAVTALVIRNDVAFTLTVKIKAWTLTAENVYPLTIRVCGAETIELSNPTENLFFVNGQ